MAYLKPHSELMDRERKRKLGSEVVFIWIEGGDLRFWGSLFIYEFKT